MQHFVKQLSANDDFARFMNENVNGISVFDDYASMFPSLNPRIAMLVMIDFCNISVSLGHGFERYKKETVPMAMIEGLLMLQTFGALSTFGNPEYWPKIGPKIASALSGIYEIRDKKMPSGESYLQKVLEVYDADLNKRYLVLMHRFASLVSRADGRMSAAEQAYVNGLLTARDRAADAPRPVCPTPSDTDPTARLHDLVGLTSVKDEVSKLSNFIRLQEKRRSEGLRVPPISYHCVFTGNPGTGKTTVARIIADIYRELGVLKKGHLVETDRSGLVAEYVGQTAVKTNKIVDSALDGVLFIDEAYSLAQGGENDFGSEAIATLLKRMEDDRDRLVVVLAGYGDDIKQFINSNPGLQSRFNRYIHFPDYSADELAEIFELNARRYDYELTAEARAALDLRLARDVAAKQRGFGNARYVRNLFEKTLENQATRLSASDDLSREALRSIRPEDLVSC